MGEDQIINLLFTFRENSFTIKMTVMCYTTWQGGKTAMVKGNRYYDKAGISTGIAQQIDGYL